MKRITIVVTLIMSLVTSMNAANVCGDCDTLNNEWQNAVLAAINQFPERGGYYTGGRPNQYFTRTTMQALSDAFVMGADSERPVFIPSVATPSFCSSATYAVLIKALLLWDYRGTISRDAWRNMKPYVGIRDDLNPEGLFQDDGVGVWGRANANGPGIGVLVAELDAGYNFTAFRGAKNDSVKETPTEIYLSDEQWRAHPIWAKAVPGDMMKIFWDRNSTRGHDGGAIIGYDGVKGHLQEAGHSVVFLGIDNEGYVTYWSSNGPGEHPEAMGYSVARCDKTAIQRVVFTRVTRPENFDNARLIAPDSRNDYLMELNGKHHSTTDEMKRQLNCK